MGGSTLYVEAARVDAGEGKGNLRTTGWACLPAYFPLLPCQATACKHRVWLSPCADTCCHEIAAVIVLSIGVKVHVTWRGLQGEAD